MPRLKARIARACDALSLRVEFDYEVEAGGIKLTALACIPALGSPSGMLIFTDYNVLRAYANTLVQDGYGYSVLQDRDEEFDLDVYKEMFSDWGWSCQSEA